MHSGAPHVCVTNMSDYTQAEAEKAAMYLRAEHDAHARVRDGVQVERGPRDSDMTVGEALDEIVSTMRGDKFWMELADAIANVKQALVTDDEEGRSTAVGYLKNIQKEMAGLQQHWFAQEQVVLGQILGLLEGKDGSKVSSDMVLCGVRTTMSPGQAEASENRRQREKAQEMAKLAGPVLEQFQPLLPYDFLEIQNECQIRVTIKVPPSTASSDCKVKIQRDHLTVAVKGHEVQPAIIDGDLAGRLDVEACGWNVEGKGEDRRLVLELEKEMGGLQWRKLVRD